MPEENVDVKVARLEERHTALHDTVIQIRDNHLKHMADDIQRIDGKVEKVGEKVDKMALKLASWGGGVAVLIYIIKLIVDNFLK